jgi:energy-coupling factor transport system ATP-binding protein
MLVATHDVEFVARIASRVVVLAEGDVVTDAPVEDAIASSPVFAPQVAKVMAPQRWLTVDQVAAALGSVVTRG